MNRLTIPAIRAAKAKGMYADGGGLYLQVSTWGTKAWIFRYTLKGKSRQMGLGPLNTVSLKTAREEAQRCRNLLREGIDPIESRDPKALREELELSPHTTCLSFGMQVGDYGQLRDAVSFLGDNGAEIKYLPPELFPGIDYSAFALDPDGHAIQLYYYMEQIGWDGKPRPASQRPQIASAWPESVDPQSDTFVGEPFLGPLG